MTKIAKIVFGIAIIFGAALESKGDFTLRNSEQLTVDSPNTRGYLYDDSHADIVIGANVTQNLNSYDSSTVDVLDGRASALYAYHNSVVNVYGGSVDNFYPTDSSTMNIFGGTLGYPRDMIAYKTSTVNISGGEVRSIDARDNSILNISGGLIRETLKADDTSIINISGGELLNVDVYADSVINISGGFVYSLWVNDSGIVNITARDFHLGGGLSLNDNQVFGTGLLNGEWYDGTSWTLGIENNGPRAKILIPEPITLSLLSLGSLALLRKKRVL